LFFFFFFRLKDSSDMIFDIVPFAICTQFHAACSVIIASFPTLKSFLNNTSTGMLNVSIAPRSGTTYGYASYHRRRMSSISKLSHHPVGGDSKYSSTVFQRSADSSYGHNTPPSKITTPKGKETKPFGPENIQHCVTTESAPSFSRAASS